MYESIIAETKNLISSRLNTQKFNPLEYPYGAGSTGKRFVFYRTSFNDIAEEEKEELRMAIDSIISLNNQRFELIFRAEWSRGRE